MRGINWNFICVHSGYDFSKFDIEKNETQSFEFWQKLIESMKFSYAQRGLLGDPLFVPAENISKVQLFYCCVYIFFKIISRYILNSSHI